MSIEQDAKNLIQYVQSLKSAGAEFAQNTPAPTADIGLFTDDFPQWVADGGLEKAGHITQYKGTAYKASVDNYRFETAAPDVATNVYNPYPKPDADGVYPYIYGMGVRYGMKVRYNDIVYLCILSTGQQDYKLVYPPSDVPALFEVYHEEV